jgi:hypothetical protein
LTTGQQDIARVREMIRELPPEAQTRINLIVGILHGLLEADEAGEVELALTLVLAELADG